MITENGFREKVIKLSRRIDVNPPKVRIVPSDSGSMAVRCNGLTITVETHTLRELTDAEMDFALSLALCKQLHHKYWLVPIWLFPTFFTGVCGYLAVTHANEYFIEHFNSGVIGLFCGFAIGYFISEILVAWFIKSHRNRIFHDAMVFSGNAQAAESYLIRLQADQGGMKLRKKLSNKRKDELDRQLNALEDACGRLGLAYRSVTGRIS